MNTVKLVADFNMCISCGLCTAVCPKQCIELVRKGGMNKPEIGKACVSCGRCFNVCPGKGNDYRDIAEKYETDKGLFWVGPYIKIFTAKTRDKKKLQNAVSGGTVTELVNTLLCSGIYDSAFLVDDNSFQNDRVVTNRYLAKDELNTTQKSRYILVSHERAIDYILSHRTEKVILVGTSCFIQGLKRVIETYQLDCSNYFLIGLFCDRTMNMNVINYFKGHSLCKGALTQFYFRTKDNGGWPGGVRLVCNGTNIDLPNVERIMLKDFFQPERCLYCLDKLNMYSDISLGDNYTGVDSGIEGSNSVVIRTSLGESIWSTCMERFDVEESTVKALQKSQHLTERTVNYWYARLKEKSIGWVINELPISISSKVELSNDVQDTYQSKMRQISKGADYLDNPRALIVVIKKMKIKASLKRIILRIMMRSKN